jgi:ketosteroid isomerase-like protein
MPDADFDVIRRAWAAFSRNDEDAIRRELHRAVEIVPFGAAMEGASYCGPDEVIRWWREEILTVWETFETLPEQFLPVGEQILVTGRWRARGKGSGVSLERPAVWVVTVRAGKIVSWRTYTDLSQARREVGLER